jgi:hypothetical protein
MNVRTATALGCCLFVFTNCATTSKLAPLSPLTHDIPVPMQQEQMAAAARTAVKQAVGGLDFSELIGKVARVQVAGVFPPSNHDLLDFVGAVAESELAQHGVRIEPQAVPHAVLIQNNGTLIQPDFVTSLTLDAAGVDLTLEPQLTGPIVMMAVGGGSMVLGGSVILLGAAAFSFGISIIGGVLGVIGLPLLIIGAIWAATAPSHYIADGRVRLAASVQPVTLLIRPQTKRGEGTNSIRYEPNQAGGLKPRMPMGW